MPKLPYFFLFNDEDGSYNSHSRTKFPNHMNHDGVTERILDVDPDEFEDISLVFFDEVAGGVVDASNLIIRLQTEKGAEVLTALLSETGGKAERTPEEISNFNTLVTLARKYLPAAAVGAILKDGVIDSEEAAAIKAAMQAATPKLQKPRVLNEEEQKAVSKEGAPVKALPINGAGK